MSYVIDMIFVNKSICNFKIIKIIQIKRIILQTIFLIKKNHSPDILPKLLILHSAIHFQINHFKRNIKLG